jgi:outer membrane receptor protein involved in Fe transport
VSFRINTTYDITPLTTFHLGYSRYFTPPPLEAVSQETITKFNGTTNASASDENSPLRSERSNYFDAGISQHLSKHAQIGLDGYYKRASDQLDEGQFGSALILSPFNFRQGRVIGLEQTTSYQDDQFTGYINIALSKAQGKDINTAQFLFSEEELAYGRSHSVYLDHDQRWSVSAGISYQFLSKTMVSVDGIGGTGLRSGFASTDHVPAYATMNLGIVQRYHHFQVRFDIVNIFDRIYEIRDGSGIGVAAPAFGPRRGYYGGLKYDF